jgi:hypothetical protein
MLTLKTQLRTVGSTLILALVTVFVLALPVASSGLDLPGASLTVCQVSGSASAPSFAQVQVPVDQLAAHLSQNQGSFVGACPASSGGGSGSGGGSDPPLKSAATVCRVSGSSSAPVFSEVLVGADQVAVFLNQNPGSFSGGCPTTAGGGNAGGSNGGSGTLTPVATVCRVSGSANAQDNAELTLDVDQVAAYLQ